MTSAMNAVRISSGLHPPTMRDAGGPGWSPPPGAGAGLPLSAAVGVPDPLSRHRIRSTIRHGWVAGPTVALPGKEAGLEEVRPEVLCRNEEAEGARFIGGAGAGAERCDAVLEVVGPEGVRARDAAEETLERAEEEAVEGARRVATLLERRPPVGLVLALSPPPPTERLRSGPEPPPPTRGDLSASEGLSNGAKTLAREEGTVTGRAGSRVGS